MRLKLAATCKVGFINLREDFILKTYRPPSLLSTSAEVAQGCGGPRPSFYLGTKKRM